MRITVLPNDETQNIARLSVIIITQSKRNQNIHTLSSV